MDNGRRKGRAVREVGRDALREPERVQGGDGAGDERSPEPDVPFEPVTGSDGSPYIHTRCDTDVDGYEHTHAHFHAYSDPDPHV